MMPPQCNDKAPFLPGQQVEVLLPRPLKHNFTYRVAEGMAVPPGSYVRVPFGQRELIGVVWGETRAPLADVKCKEVLECFAHVPPMPEAMRRWLDWVAAYTMSPRGAVLKLALSVPDALSKPPVALQYLLAATEQGQLTPERRKVIKRLQALPSGCGLSAAQLKHDCAVSHAVLAGMARLGMLRLQERLALPERPAFLAAVSAPPLRDEQQTASAAILAALDKNEPVVLALEGVTGSGKTEVYFDVIESLLRQGDGQALVLLPEIALTTQWIARFATRFGDGAVLWHSSVGTAARKRGWLAAALGTAPVVVGARSALFLPFANLRIIVVDEEHEASYKQEEGVLYHARDMAVARAHHEKIPALLCSATLSLETQYNCTQGKYAALTLQERHGSGEEARPELVDLRSNPAERGCWLSPPLREALIATYRQGQQSLLYLNRRGYAPLLLCRTCGHRFQCDQCSAWLVQHQSPPRLQCHHCDTRRPLPQTCPECGSDELAACGPGVERIGEEVAALLPEARRCVLSSDAGELSSQLEAIIRGDTDIIIGTQLVAKGHHFPALALVGIVDGDIGLEGGDLRASERTYQLLHQLAGRAGREKAGARVLLQTLQPEHPLMQALALGEGRAFLEQELRQREAGGWPPFGRLAGILLEGRDEAALRRHALALMQAAPRYDGLQYLGPAPAPIARARGKYRYRILIKAPRKAALQQILQEWLARVPEERHIQRRMDIDPYNFM